MFKINLREIPPFKRRTSAPHLSMAAVASAPRADPPARPGCDGPSWPVTGGNHVTKIWDSVGYFLRLWGLIGRNIPIQYQWCIILMEALRKVQHAARV